MTRTHAHSESTLVHVAKTIAGWLTGTLVKQVLGWIGAAVVFIMIANPITHWWGGPTAFKVYLVGDFRAEQQAARQIRDGFLLKGNPAVKIDGLPVEIEVKDDEGDASRAAAVAEEVVTAGDAVLVVGHLSSTQTKIALPIYLTKAHPSIPVLLAAETNPYLYSPATPKTIPSPIVPVLRIPPTDERQAFEAAAYATARGAKTFWVIEDSENPVYSKFLSAEFMRRVQEKKQSVVFWANNSNLPSIDTFRALRPHCIFFSGSASNALILIQQIRAFARSASIPMPMVILTDSAADPILLANGGAEVEGINLIYPWPAKEFSNGSDGFVSVGKDARTVVEALVDELSRRYTAIQKERGAYAQSIRSLLRIRDVEDARESLHFVIDRVIRERTVFQLGGQRKAIFTQNMKNDLSRFYIWEVREGKFVDVQ
jgi:ABC-type branched-subunit amino acid transport system substrate-binding protein